MTTLRRIIEVNYCGIEEDINQIELAVKEWLTQAKQLIEQDTKESFPDDSDLPHNIGRVMELEDLIESLCIEEKSIH
jgi:hypothetical protein